MTTTIPTSDIDLYSDESVLSPYGNYQELRDLGPATWLEQYQVWVVPRYQEVYAALHDHESFSSGSGVGLTDELNRVMAGGTIASDPPEHDRIRRVLGRQLTPKALRQHQEHVQQRADRLVDELIGRERFDAVTDFAQTFPISLVPDLLGWPEGGREHLLEWASAGFNALGPMNDRTISGMPVLRSLWEFLGQMASSRNLRAGSWGANLVAAVDAGEIGDELLPTLLGDFLVPSLDTTVSALASAMWLLGTHPDQWQKIRQDHSLIPNAFNEIIRYEAPARGFCRLLTRDHKLNGLTLPAGSRVLLLYASANRDERYWQSPGNFDVTRSNASSHVGFGHGIHGCVGQGLARLEGHALLTSLATRVHRIDVDEPTWRLHNTIRGIASLPATLRT